MIKITAPAGKAAAGTKAPGGGVFDQDGVTETDSEAVIAYARAAGYGIGDEPPTYQPPDLTQRDAHGREVDPRLVEARHLSGYPELRQAREADGARERGYAGRAKTAPAGDAA